MERVSVKGKKKSRFWFGTHCTSTRQLSIWSQGRRSTPCSVSMSGSMQLCFDAGRAHLRNWGVAGRRRTGRPCAGCRAEPPPLHRCLHRIMQAPIDHSTHALIRKLRGGRESSHLKEKARWTLRRLPCPAASTALLSTPHHRPLTNDAFHCCFKCCSFKE